MMPGSLNQLLATFINALHILHKNAVFDAYGHLSVRNPSNSSTFFLSRNLAPALVSSASDIVEYHVSDASPVRSDAPSGFIERYIHSEIYKRFSDINAVVHSHSLAVLPYTISGVPLRPSIHMAGFLGSGVPVFEIAEYYRSNDTQDLLIRDVRLGAALAAQFEAESSDAGDSPHYSVVLMRGHGFTTCANSIEAVVVQAIYTQVNAQAQSEALAIQYAYSGSKASSGDGLVYLTPQQARDSSATISSTYQRPWDLWVREAKVSPLYVNELDP